MNYKVIYMTGAPAAGKSTFCRAMLDQNKKIKLFEFGKEMANHLKTKLSKGDFSQDIIKAGVDGFVSQEDIDVIDQLVVDYINKWCKDHHVLIDSHHVTKEKYGFRASVFSVEKASALSPTEVWVLYSDAATTIKRIQKNAEGRPTVSHFEADMHTFLQGSLAMNYGIAWGIPVFFFDTNNDKEIILDRLLTRLEAKI